VRTGTILESTLTTPKHYKFNYKNMKQIIDDYEEHALHYSDDWENNQHRCSECYTSLKSASKLFSVASARESLGLTNQSAIRSVADYREYMQSE
jgi:hypothetical protein